nr:MAG TPA: hypothetical protein [Caudoviricetes sp.]
MSAKRTSAPHTTHTPVLQSHNGSRITVFVVQRISFLAQKRIPAGPQNVNAISFAFPFHLRFLPDSVLVREPCAEKEIGVAFADLHRFAHDCRHAITQHKAFPFLFGVQFISYQHQIERTGSAIEQPGVVIFRLHTVIQHFHFLLNRHFVGRALGLLRKRFQFLPDAGILGLRDGVISATRHIAPCGGMVHKFLAQLRKAGFNGVNVLHDFQFLSVFYLHIGVKKKNPCGF